MQPKGSLGRCGLEEAVYFIAVTFASDVPQCLVPSVSKASQIAGVMSRLDYTYFQASIALNGTCSNEKSLPLAIMQWQTHTF